MTCSDPRVDVADHEGQLVLLRKTSHSRWAWGSVVSGRHARLLGLRHAASVRVVVQGGRGAIAWETDAAMTRRTGGTEFHRLRDETVRGCGVADDAG